MKAFTKKYLFTTCISFIGINSSMALTDGNWVHIASPMQNGAPYQTSLAISKNGTPYVAYDDSNHLRHASVIRYDPTYGWQYVGSPGFSNNSVDKSYNSPEIEVDNNQIPYVIYGDNGFEINVKRFNGKEWEFVGAEGFSHGMMYNATTHLVFDRTNTPYIAFIKFLDSTNNRLTVMKYTNKNWVEVGEFDASTVMAGAVSLALDSHENLYVAYVDMKSSYNPAVMKYTSATGWVSLNYPKSNTEVVSGYQNIDLAIDRNDIPYIVYPESDATFKHSGKVARYIANHWETVGVFPGSHSNFRIAIDSKNIPHVSYNEFPEWKATVMKHNGDNNWVSVGSTKFSDGQSAYGLSLALDVAGTPYISYGLMNYPVYGTTVMKFQN